MRDLHLQIDVRAADPADVWSGDLHAAQIADHVCVRAPLVLAARTRVSTDRTKRGLIIKGAALLSPIAFRVKSRRAQHAERLRTHLIARRGAVFGRDVWR